MGILTSKSFKDDPKLEACAVSDPAHLTIGTKGAHVGKVQAALTIVDGAVIDSEETGDTRYGFSTANAVVRFKTARNILNFRGQIDNIVGKKTIVALDRELKPKEGPAPTPPPAPDRGNEAEVTFARSQALLAIGVVEHHIQFFQFAASTGMPRDLQSAAFNNHFKLVVDAAEAAPHRPNTRVFNPRTDTTFIPTIRSNFRKLAQTLSNPAKFRMVTEAEARREGGVNTDGSIVAAYVAGVGTFVRITPVFNQPTRGPFCQVAIVIHEALHVVDARSGDDATTHIPEWQSADPPINAKFGFTNYDRQRPEHAIHNPSAYGAFAIHLARLRDERFGDGRQTE